MSTRIFYIFNDRPTTFAQFGVLVNQRAKALLSWHGHTIGLWADHDPDFVINLFALWKVGAIPLLVSRRLPWTMVSTLLENAQASAILTPDPSVCIGGVPAFSSACGSLGPDAEISHSCELPEIGSALQTTALILHTSGTTNVPKLVRISRNNLFACLDVFEARWKGIWTEADASLGCLPLFHVIGLLVELLPNYRRRSAYYFADSNPYGILQSLQKGNGAITLLFTVPWMARQLLDIPGGPEALRRLRHLNLGGAALDEGLGQRLDQAGVRSVQGYGMTELGICLMSSLEGGDWRNMLPVIPENFFHLDEETGLLIIHADCPTLAISLPGDFVTGDFFRRTPEGGYRYQSRTEDILVHDTGEKSNALAIEQMLQARLGEWIEHAAVVGNGRLRLACILLWKREPTAADHEALLQSLAAINAELPAHSQLQKDLLLFLAPVESHRLPLTGKKTVSRKKAEIEFGAELEHLYAGANQALNGTAIESFFDHPEEIDPYESLFNRGLDSVRAVAFRNYIARLYPTHDIPLNIVFQFPTLDGLNKYLQGTPLPTRVPPAFPPFQQEQIDAARWEYPLARHVLLTGANGFIGQHLVETLSQCNHIEHIYCPIRRNPAELPSHQKVTYYQGYDFSNPLFGLSPEDHQALLARVDTIIHAAWPVNFNMTYEHMAASALPSLHHLIEFARHGDKTLHFLSSVSTVMLHPTKSRVDEEWPLPTPAACFPFGYAQTKWEAEQVLIRSGVRHKIHRFGQISAHTKTGKWNDQEHIPILIKASRVLGCAPVIPLPVDWVPVDIACEAFLELMSVPKVNVHHIANPNPRRSECLTQGTLSLPLELWLAAAEPHLDAHPNLLSIWSFLQEMLVHTDRLTPLAADATCAHSSKLAACSPISDAYLASLFPKPAPFEQQELKLAAS
jgi:acyl-coenzyme A synthetase/AMP-(fatty) acid ligase/nucleoside-diphosphate-sugar epimerase